MIDRAHAFARSIFGPQQNWIGIAAVLFLLAIFYPLLVVFG